MLVITLENLIDALDDFNRAEGTATEARAESRLLDAAIEAGMAYDHDDLAGWASATVGAWLQSDPYGDVSFDGFDGWGVNEHGKGEYVS